MEKVDNENLSKLVLNLYKIKNIKHYTSIRKIFLMEVGMYIHVNILMDFLINVHVTRQKFMNTQLEFINFCLSY